MHSPTRLPATERRNIDHRWRRLSAACVAAVAVLCLQACGGGGDDDPDADRSVSIPTPPRVPVQLSV